MAEIGVVQFARVARDVAEAALPRYRGPCSKHAYLHVTDAASDPLSHALRGLDLREAEVRLCEHAELRAMLGIDWVPDSTPLYRCLPMRLTRAAFWERGLHGSGLTVAVLTKPARSGSG